MKISPKTLIKKFLKKNKMLIIINFDKFLYLTKYKKVHCENVIFVSEKNDWAIKLVGQNITEKLNQRNNNFIKFTISPKYYQNKIIHFGSQYMWVDWWKNMPKKNHYIVSFFHGKKEDGEDVKKHISDFLESLPYITTIIVSSSIVKTRLLSWGIPLDKISLIPIGVNNSHFKPVNDIQKNKVRTEYGLKKTTVVIGSFQKDGIGWGQGQLPKLIKGPDIFIEVVKLLKEQGYDILVFLTGPARGYVKQELRKINVKFIHKYFENQNDLLNCYHVLNLYLITSREEGGPMGLMEAMASGVPVVSTPVGMSIDLIKNNISGKIAIDFEAKNLLKLVKELLSNKKLNKKIIRNALSVVDDVNWYNISEKHYSEVYLPLINK